MIIKKTVNLRFNMGHYEHVELFATAEVDTIADRDDLARNYRVDTDDHSAVMEHITDVLTEIVKPEVDMVLQTSDYEDSFVFPFADLTTTKGKKN